MLLRSKSLSHALKLSAACIALSVPSIAFAQEAPQADDTAEEEIVVTAQGRSQLLSDVPVAISAVNAETLQNSCLLYTSPSPRDAHESRMPSSA